MEVLNAYFSITAKRLCNSIDMAPRGYFTTGSLSAFIFLGIIRGSFSVAIYFAVHSYKSPSLVFLLRTPGAIALYAIFMIFLSMRDSEIKEIFYDNYKTVRNYWKFAVMGFVQLAAPYMLFMYALQVLNPTTAGSYMAAAPWFSILLERLPFVRVSSVSISPKCSHCSCEL